MQAAQITVEDYILSNVEVAPLTVVGWEGIWGTIVMIILMIIIQVCLLFIPVLSALNFIPKRGM